MQQTETYQLNKIDMDDTFSPTPLNDNADKVDAALAALDGADAALDSRVTVLEGQKIAVGTYYGNSRDETTVQLGFRPRAVIIQQPKYTGDCFMATAAGGCVIITDTGFATRAGTGVNSGLHNYVAIS